MKNEKLLHEKITERVNIALEKQLNAQKGAGKKFPTDQEIDDLIDNILKEELGDQYVKPQ